MKTIDTNGRILLNTVPTVFEAGLTIGFADVGTNVKFVNGKIYVKDDVDGFWYPLGRAGALYPGDTPLP